MWKCPKCNEYRFNDVNTCRCKEFIVKNEDGEEYNVQAMDEEGAALKYAQESNENNDYYLMNERRVITVNDTKYEISAEPDVHYSADAIE